VLQVLLRMTSLKPLCSETFKLQLGFELTDFRQLRVQIVRVLRD
jgi:hypothetical protein